MVVCIAPRPPAGIRAPPFLKNECGSSTCFLSSRLYPKVRKPEQLASLAGLIIPGGESTTMALVAEEWGLVSPPLFPLLSLAISLSLDPWVLDP